MPVKRFRPVFFTLLVTLPLGATGAALASPAPSPRITICYNKKTTVVRYSKFGRCAAGFKAVVVGKGIIGAAGVRGVAGPRGVPGLAGAAGPAGGTGGTGATGGQGNAGVNVFHTVVSAPDTSAFGIVTANCDEGEVVTGGGYTTSASTGSVAIKDSNPTAARTGWQVNHQGGSAVVVTAYAICVAGTNT